MMTEFEWSRIRFLESAGNLVPRVHALTGRQPSNTIARDIAACLQQGRQFYEAAQDAPLQIRPLLLFYGMAGFSKALILANRVASIATLKQTHGLSDVSPSPCEIASLALRVQREGTFQEFNDVAKEYHRVRYLDTKTTPRYLLFSASASVELSNLQLSLKDILGRIPYLEELYVDTFTEAASTISLTLHPFGEPHKGANTNDRWEIRMADKALFTDFDSLIKIVGRLRERFPFLSKWRLLEADHFLGETALRFENGADPLDAELDMSRMSSAGDKYTNKLSTNYLPIAGMLPPLSGGFTERSAYATMPVDGKQIAEFSLHFMGLYLLSSLVRYRPATWSHAVSRTGTSDAPADDKALAIIERFLTLNCEIVPTFVVSVLNPNAA